MLASSEVVKGSQLSLVNAMRVLALCETVYDVPAGAMQRKRRWQHFYEPCDMRLGFGRWVMQGVMAC